MQSLAALTGGINRDDSESKWLDVCVHFVKNLFYRFLLRSATSIVTCAHMYRAQGPPNFSEGTSKI